MFIPSKWKLHILLNLFLFGNLGNFIETWWCCHLTVLLKFFPNFQVCPAWYNGIPYSFLTFFSLARILCYCYARSNRYKIPIMDERWTRQTPWFKSLLVHGRLTNTNGCSQDEFCFIRSHREGSPRIGVGGARRLHRCEEGRTETRRVGEGSGWKRQQLRTQQ